MEGEQEKILMYSRYVDEKLIEWYRTKNAAVKQELRKAQENLDQLVLGRKLKQDEIDQLIKEGVKWKSYQSKIPESWKT